jgi:hypothetical protein
MTSGALYHLVATYSVMKPPPPAGPASGGGFAADLAKPRSQIWASATISQGKASWYTLRSQFAFRRRLEGFRSRCRTFAEWIALSPRIAWLSAEFPTDERRGDLLDRWSTGNDHWWGPGSWWLGAYKSARSVRKAYSSQVRLHQFLSISYIYGISSGRLAHLYKIDLCEIRITTWDNDIKDWNDILVTIVHQWLASHTRTRDDILEMPQ